MKERKKGSKERVPAPEQYCVKFDEHLEPCPWHHHRRTSNHQKKSDSKSMRPAEYQC